MQDELVQVQPKFKSNLLESVEVFREDVNNFTEAYETVNYMWDTACSSVCGVGFCGIKRERISEAGRLHVNDPIFTTTPKGSGYPSEHVTEKASRVDC